MNSLQMGWSIALGPWKQLPLNLLVLWMAGNSISIFPIMMVGMMLVRPVQAIFNCKEGGLQLKFGALWNKIHTLCPLNYEQCCNCANTV